MITLEKKFNAEEENYRKKTIRNIYKYIIPFFITTYLFFSLFYLFYIHNFFYILFISVILFISLPISIILYYLQGISFYKLGKRKYLQNKSFIKNLCQKFSAEIITGHLLIESFIIILRYTFNHQKYIMIYSFGRFPPFIELAIPINSKKIEIEGKYLIIDAKKIRIPVHFQKNSKYKLSTFNSNQSMLPPEISEWIQTEPFLNQLFQSQLKIIIINKKYDFWKYCRKPISLITLHPIIMELSDLLKEDLKRDSSYKYIPIE